MIKKNVLYKKYLNFRKRTKEQIKEIKAQYKKFTSQKLRELIKTEIQRSNIINRVAYIGQLFKQKNLINAGKFNELFNYIEESGTALKDDLFNLFYSKASQGKNFLKFTDQTGERRTIPMNIKNKQLIRNLLTNLYTDEEDTSLVGSDAFNDVIINYVSNIRIVSYELKFLPINKNGSYFRYVNTTQEDLTRYQIYKTDDNKDLENCFIKTLILNEINNDDINTVKKFIVGGAYIRKSNIKNIVDIIKSNITIYEYNCDEEINKITYGKFKNNIDIAIYENHYFIYEKTKYSRYCIDNYEELKDKKEFYDIYKKDRYNKTQRKLNSLQLVNRLFKLGYFIKGDETESHEYKEDKEISICLDYIENEQMIYEPKTTIRPTDYKNIGKIIYADTETYVKNGNHDLMLIAYVDEETDDTNFFYEKEYKTKNFMVLDFLNKITNYGKTDCIVYFHNLKYDHHILEPYLNIFCKCAKDGQFYNVVCYHRSCKVEFRDSFKLAPFALSKFCSEFQLNESLNKKEAIAYEYYNTKILDYSKTSIDEYKKLLSYDLHDIFINNIKDFKTSSTTFDALEYYKYYLKYDCLVLKHGLIKFNEIIKNITHNKLNIFECLTISSLTDKHMTNNLAYKDIYQVNRNLRDYIGRAVYGGRVYVNPLYEKKIVEGKTADYDGVSLYPSAIKRLLCDERGLPTGPAIRFNKNELNEWNNKIYSILTVKILKVNKSQQMPMIAHRGEITDYKNEPPLEPVVIDSITLEDYIKFHKIEYELIEGVYWNEKTNNKIGIIIEQLFSERMKHKKESPCIANILKLMLNSAYGKTIMKKSDTKSIIKKTAECDKYIYNNFNTIKEIKKLNDSQSEIINFNPDLSYNRAHIGCAILSMSKRIMNEVFDVANTNNIKIYYTDTDSIHLEYDKTALLEKKYFEIYNKVLNGKALGQFHNDFNLKNSVGEVYATRSIFLGKKCYIDEMEGENDKGEIIKDYHFRLKGITQEGVNYTIKKEFNNDAFKMFKFLMSGKKINFLLNPYDETENKKKVLFDFKTGEGVRTKDLFYREISF